MKRFASWRRRAAAGLLLCACMLVPACTEEQPRVQRELVDGVEIVRSPSVPLLGAGGLDQVLEIGVADLGPGDHPSHLFASIAAAVVSGDALYVLDFGTRSVRVFELDGTPRLDFGREGAGPGEFRLPARLDVDAEGRVYVWDRGLRHISIFDAHGRHLVNRDLATLGAPSYYSDSDLAAWSPDHVLLHGQQMLRGGNGTSYAPEQFVGHGRIFGSHRPYDGYAEALATLAGRSSDPFDYSSFFTSGHVLARVDGGFFYSREAFPSEIIEYSAAGEVVRILYRPPGTPELLRIVRGPRDSVSAGIHEGFIVSAAHRAAGISEAFVFREKSLGLAADGERLYSGWIERPESESHRLHVDVFDLEDGSFLHRFSAVGEADGFAGVDDAGDFYFSSSGRSRSSTALYPRITRYRRSQP